jgi:hypothetical protein
MEIVDIRDRRERYGGTWSLVLLVEEDESGECGDRQLERGPTLLRIIRVNREAVVEVQREWFQGLEMEIALFVMAFGGPMIKVYRGKMSWPRFIRLHI